MHRSVALLFLLLFSIPFGMSISGCGNKTSVVFCNGSDSGPIQGQLANIALTPRVYGLSLNFGQKNLTVPAPAGTDCNGASVTATGYRYSTTDMTLADVNPSTGSLCGGNWNRNSGGGVPDYTICTPTNKQGTAYVKASAQNVTSNPFPVYVHPQVSNVVLGAPSTDCLNDPATNCSPASATSSTGSTTSCTLLSNGCCSVPYTAVPVSASAANGCLSQGSTGQLATRVFGANGDNISCAIGHVTYAPQAPSVVTIDNTDGTATAATPGSTLITATLSNAGSSAGFFSTCPPASIVLSAPGVPPGTVVRANQNTPQALTATVTDTRGVNITGLSLQYISTTPKTLPSGGAGSVTPIFPGTGAITAQCLPPSCNPAPLNEIGLFGNGLPAVSNAVTLTTPGTNSTVLYIASTGSQYIVPVDFTTGTVGAAVRLPYVPNSMVISNDGSTIYLGSPTELMVFSTGNNALAREDITTPGAVLAISPDNTTLAIADTARQLVYLAFSNPPKGSGSIQTSYGGIGQRAEFSPDSNTVYIAAGTQLLVHAAFTGWTAASTTTDARDVAVTVPSVGAFFAGPVTTARGYCPATSIVSNGGQQTTTNVFFPDAGVAAPVTDRIVATNDGVHILGASVTSGAATLTDLQLSHATAGGTAPGPTHRRLPQHGPDFYRQPCRHAGNPRSHRVLDHGHPSGLRLLDRLSHLSRHRRRSAFVHAVRHRWRKSGLGCPPDHSRGAAPIAPVAGVFSSDNTTFFTGTSGDNLVHLINPATLQDQPSRAIAPKLPGINGGIATPDLLVQRPRSATS